MTATCGQIREILSGAIDGVFLVDGESELMSTHLADCSECREHQERLQGAVTLLQGLPYLVEAPAVSAPSSSFLGKLSQSLMSLESTQSSGEAVEAEADLAVVHQSSTESSRNKKTRSRRGKRSSARRQVPAKLGEDPCEDFRELISGSLDDSLLPSESDQLSKHISLCLACADYQSRLSLQCGTLENFSLVEPGEDFLDWISETLTDCAQLERDALTKEVWAGRLTWARKQTGPLLKLAAAVLLVLGAFAFLQQQLNPPKKTRRIAKDSKKDSTNNGLGKDKADPNGTQSPNIIPKPDNPKTIEPKKDSSQKDPDSSTPPENPKPEIPDTNPDKTPKNPENPGNEGRNPGRTIEKKPVQKQEIDLAALDKLLREIKDRRTSSGARSAKLAALSNFDHERTYLFLNDVMKGRMDDYVQSQTIYVSACNVLGDLDTKPAAEVLWNVPANPQVINPTHIAKSVAKFRNKEAISVLASRAANDGFASERPYAFIAGLSWRDNHAASRCFNEALSKRNKSQLNTKKKHLSLLNYQLAISLGRIGAQEDLTLLGHLASGKVNPSLRLASVEAIGDLQHPNVTEVLAALKKPLSTKYSKIREKTALAISQYTDPKAISALIKRLGQEKNARVTSAIRAGLYQLTGLNKKNHREWSSWWKTFEEKLTDADALKKFRGNDVRALLSNEVFGIPSRGVCSLFLLDNSMSMGRDKKFARAVSELKRALRILLTQPRLNKKSRYFNIRLFSDSSRPLLNDGGIDFFEVNPANINKACALLNRVKVQNSPTKISKAFEQAFNLRKNLTFDTIYLISDGIPTLGEAPETHRIAYRVGVLNRVRRAVIHTIGIYDGKRPLFLDTRNKVKGDGIWKGFLRQLADSNGGFFVSNYLVVKKPKLKKPK